MPAGIFGALYARVTVRWWFALFLILCASAALFAAPQRAHADITTNLVLWWELEEGTGVTANDSSAQNNGGSLDVAGAPAWVSSGQAGGIYALDFSSDAGTADTLTGFPTTGDYTVSAWVNADTITTDHRIVNMMGTTNWFAGNINMVVNGDAGDIVVCYVPNVGDVSVSTSISKGTWYHVTCVYDNAGTDTMTMYINGSQVDQVSGFTPNTEASDGFYIGAGNYGAEEFFDGKIDEVRVYSRALTGPDVLELYAYGSDAYTPTNLTASSTTGGVNLTWTAPTAGAPSCTPSVGGTVKTEIDASQSTYTLSSYTVSASPNNQILVVTASSEAEQTASSATYNGQSMILVDSVGFQEGGGEGAAAAIFYLVNPPVTTANVVVTYSPSDPDFRAGVSASVLDCVDTATAPLENSATGVGNVSASVTVVTPNTILIDALGNSENSSVSATTQAGQTALFAEDLVSGSEWASSYKLEAGTGSSAMGWSGLNLASALVVAGFAPQGGGDGTNFDTYGVWRATKAFVNTSEASLIASFSSTTATSYSDTSVTRGIGYYYRVTASIDSSTSSPSNMRFSGSNSGRVIRLGGWRGVVQ